MRRAELSGKLKDDDVIKPGILIELEDGSQYLVGDINMKRWWVR